MTPLALRLVPGDDLRRALEAAVADAGCEAAFVLSGIGSLGTTLLRFANADDPTMLAGPTEILTLAGSISVGGSHLHASVADALGRVHGGHVACGCIVRTTAEVLLALLPGWQFARTLDPATGYAELQPRRVSPA